MSSRPSAPPGASANWRLPKTRASSAAAKRSSPSTNSTSYSRAVSARGGGFGESRRPARRAPRRLSCLLLMEERLAPSARLRQKGGARLLSISSVSRCDVWRRPERLGERGDGEPSPPSEIWHGAQSSGASPFPSCVDNSPPNAAAYRVRRSERRSAQRLDPARLLERSSLLSPRLSQLRRQTVGHETAQPSLDRVGDSQEGRFGGESVEGAGFRLGDAKLNAAQQARQGGWVCRSRFARWGRRAQARLVARAAPFRALSVTGETSSAPSRLGTSGSAPPRTSGLGLASRPSRRRGAESPAPACRARGRTSPRR